MELNFHKALWGREAMSCEQRKGGISLTVAAPRDGADQAVLCEPLPPGESSSQQGPEPAYLSSLAVLPHGGEGVCAVRVLSHSPLSSAAEVPMPGEKSSSKVVGQGLAVLPLSSPTGKAKPGTG